MQQKKWPIPFDATTMMTPEKTPDKGGKPWKDSSSSGLPGGLPFLAVNAASSIGSIVVVAFFILSSFRAWQVYGTYILREKGEGSTDRRRLPLSHE